MIKSSKDKKNNSLLVAVQETNVASLKDIRRSHLKTQPRRRQEIENEKMMIKRILLPVFLFIAIVALSSQACFLPTRDQASIMLSRLLSNYPIDSIQPGLGGRFGTNGQLGSQYGQGLGGQGSLYGQQQGLNGYGQNGYGQNRLNNGLQNGGLPLNNQFGNGQLPYNNQYSLNNPSG